LPPVALVSDLSRFSSVAAMPPKGYKRPATAAVPETPRRGRRKTLPKMTEAEQRCEVITAALHDVNGVPEAAKDMLIAALPPCLSVTKDKRHPLPAQRDQHGRRGSGGTSKRAGDCCQ